MVSFKGVRDYRLSGSRLVRIGKCIQLNSAKLASKNPQIRNISSVVFER
jgi:hypothetical protein